MCSFVNWLIILVLLYILDWFWYVDVFYICWWSVLFFSEVRIGWWVVFVICRRYLFFLLVVLVVFDVVFIWCFDIFDSCFMLFIIIVILDDFVSRFWENCVVKVECFLFILCIFCLFDLLSLVLVWIKLE